MSQSPIWAWSVQKFAELTQSSDLYLIEKTREAEDSSQELVLFLSSNTPPDYTERRKDFLVHRMR